MTTKRMPKVKLDPRSPFAVDVPTDVLQQIVFGTKVAASLAITDPADLPAFTASRIWANIQSYLASGDWPDRRRSAAEIAAELVAGGVS